MESNQENRRIPLIGEEAPKFRAMTTQGKINFPEDYSGKWVVLFSHPADFTPVCTTEFIAFAEMFDEFNAINTELLGLSIDSLSSHIAWIRSIENMKWDAYNKVEIKFPVIADISMKVSNLFGMIHPSAANTQTVRAVFIIDPAGIIRTVLYYPMTLGRNFSEIKRIIMALQKADEEHVSTPANWQPGDDVVLPSPLTAAEAAEREKMQDDDHQVLDWYLCLKKSK